jgi:hypothetical protein
LFLKIDPFAVVGLVGGHRGESWKS